MLPHMPYPPTHFIFSFAPYCIRNYWTIKMEVSLFCIISLVLLLQIRCFNYISGLTNLFTV